ncbi:MAG: ABC transporter ATP-binding protein/permease [Acidimicrobiales bacterium]|nr:ABC transporter ATP-binding protein/permease [Acidimicrobiales bacterium]
MSKREHGIDGPGDQLQDASGPTRRERRAERQLRVGDQSLWRYFARDRVRMAAVVAVALVATQAEAMTTLLVLPAAQTIASGEQTFDGDVGPLHLSASVESLLAFAVVTIAVAGFFTYLSGLMRARFMTEWELHRRNELVRDFALADWPTQAGARRGTLPMLSTYASRGSVVIGAAVNATKSLLSVVLLLGVALLVDWRAAGGVVAFSAVLFVVLRPLALRVKTYAKRASRTNIAYAQALEEAGATVRDLRVFGGREAVLERLEVTSDELRELRLRSQLVSNVVGPLYTYTGLLLVVGVLFSATRISSIEVVALGTVAVLLVRSLSYGQQFQTAYQVLLDAVPFLDRMEEARAHYTAHREPQGGSRLEVVHDLELRHVDYSYEGDELALRDVNVRLPAGATVGVVGPSGGGKSTLSQILLRLREPTGGELLVNGEPAAGYALASWWERISFVPQEARLVHASVADNISLFRAGVGRDEIEAAARSAGVHDVIMDLPDGYETMVGPAFRDLSGGQVQRIGIARALARGAQVLVLDEPTSALDVHSETLIQDTLRVLQGRVLLVIIAHRLSTLSICDRLVVMNEGRVEAAGTLEEVFNTNEFFRTAMEAGTLELGRGM